MPAPHTDGRTAPLVVVGDTLLDRDVTGRVRRICPDAPAPVFDEADSNERAGGAALAATLAARDGRPVTLLTAIGPDRAGDRLRDLLREAGVRVVEIPYHGRTPEKVRLVADRQVLLRMDRGTPGDLGEPAEDLTDLFGRAAAILVSDYGRGVTGLPAVRAALCAVAARRPVVWDPHPRGGQPVPGVRLVTPNESELSGAPPEGELGRRLPGLAAAASAVRSRWRAGAVAVTLGADGVLLAHGGAAPMVIPAPQRVTGDTCGAGDRFAASVASAMAGGVLISEAVQQAVRDAARFIAEQSAGTAAPASDPSTAPVDVPGVLAVAAAARDRGGTVVATGGCFDLLHAGHVATLQAARALGDCLIVCMNSDASVRSLKGPRRPLVPQEDRARLVAALGCVDGVALFHETTPLALLDRLRPDVWVKGGDYFLNDHAQPTDRPVLPEAELLRAWGGQSVVMPYLPGHSSTELIRVAQGSDTGHGGRGGTA